MLDFQNKRMIALNDALLPFRCAGELRNETFQRAIKEVDNAGWVKPDEAKDFPGNLYIAYRPKGTKNKKNILYCFGYFYVVEDCFVYADGGLKKIDGEILGCYFALPEFPLEADT